MRLVVRPCFVAIRWWIRRQRRDLVQTGDDESIGVSAGRAQIERTLLSTHRKMSFANLLPANVVPPGIHHASFLSYTNLFYAQMAEMNRLQAYNIRWHGNCTEFKTTPSHCRGAQFQARTSPSPLYQILTEALRSIGFPD